MWLEFIGENQDRFTDRTIKVLRSARDYATRKGHGVITPGHILLGLVEVKAGPGRIGLERLNIDLIKSIGELEALVETRSKIQDSVPFPSPETERVLQEAKNQAKLLNHPYIGTEHLVMGILVCESCLAAKYLMSRGANIEQFRHIVQEILGYA
jgi:ATP-dependent Clp protease ATP-binding subunit ClpC